MRNHCWRAVLESLLTQVRPLSCVCWYHLREDAAGISCEFRVGCETPVDAKSLLAGASGESFDTGILAYALHLNHSALPPKLSNPCTLNPPASNLNPGVPRHRRILPPCRQRGLRGMQPPDSKHETLSSKPQIPNPKP